MDIVIIGTGNTATILGRKLKNAGHRIVQVFGRDAKAASELAYELDSESTNYWSVINRDADIYILAVSDIAIGTILKELHLPEKTIVHTAGSVSKDLLKDSSPHYGVFYPLQSLKKESAHLPDIPILIDASDKQTTEQLKELASTITEKIVEADDAQRKKLHLAAVFCNNFTNHLYRLMEDYCNREGLDFGLLVPLIEETASRVSQINPSQAQTGPAARKDYSTIEEHLNLLNDYPQLREIYKIFTESIQAAR